MKLKNYAAPEYSLLIQADIILGSGLEKHAEGDGGDENIGVW